MDQAKIQAKINLGYAKAASRLGAPFTHYRPTDPLRPLGNMLGTLLADFDINPGFSYRAPGTYGKPLYYGLFDGTNVQVSDYLVRGGRKFFVAGYEPNKPTLCIECNAVATVRKPQAKPPSPSSYMGEQRNRYTVLMAGWPASALQGYRGARGDADLPGDVRLPWFTVLVPSFPGVTIEAMDQIADDLGRVFTVSSAENTDLGWRLTVQLAET